MHVSYSEIKNWARCPYYHKLLYLDGLKVFKGNLYTAFGSAVHTACEKVHELENKELISLFEKEFKTEAEALEEYDTAFYEEMKGQGQKIIPYIKNTLKTYFGEFEVVSVEEELYEDIWFLKERLSFKGYIDMVIRSGDELHIIDWKTTTRGWNDRKRNDKMVTSQLLLYKYYYAQKHGHPLSKIKAHFGLLSRTSGGKSRVQFYEVESDERKIEEALKYIENFRYNVNKENFVKNRLSCTYCEFKNTIHCP